MASENRPILPNDASREALPEPSPIAFQTRSIVSPESGGDGAPADARQLETEIAEVTEAVDAAFDAQADDDKAADNAPEGISGTLDVPLLGPEDFDPEELRQMLRMMMMSRKLDEKMLTLLKQGKGFFHIGSAGHEASQIALGSEFNGGEDWFLFYYRDLATALAVGMTPEEVLQAHFAKAADPSSGGRQMAEHFGKRDLNIVSTSSSVAAQYVPAVGIGLAIQRDTPDGAERMPAVYVSGGEGSTSQGAFHEALSWAAKESLPVIFHVQDNGYAISVPVAEQTPGGSIWPLLGGYTGLERVRYDGTDFFASASVARAALAHARAGKGPVALPRRCGAAPAALLLGRPQEVPRGHVARCRPSA